MPWDNSTRRARLPTNWRNLRAEILRRDPTCRACGLNASVDVDHIMPGDNHNLSNLQGLCRWCHKKKTINERPPSPTAYKPRARPPEPHPGQHPKGTTMSEQPVNNNDTETTEDDDDTQPNAADQAMADSGAETTDTDTQTGEADTTTE